MKIINECFVCVLVAQLCSTLCDPMDYIAHQAPLSMGLLQARILECHSLLQGTFLT